MNLVLLKHFCQKTAASYDRTLIFSALLIFWKAHTITNTTWPIDYTLSTKMTHSVVVKREYNRWDRQPRSLFADPAVSTAALLLHLLDTVRCYCSHHTGNKAGAASLPWQYSTDCSLTAPHTEEPCSSPLQCTTEPQPPPYSLNNIVQLHLEVTRLCHQEPH